MRTRNLFVLLAVAALCALAAGCSLVMFSPTNHKATSVDPDELTRSLAVRGIRCELPGGDKIGERSHGILFKDVGKIRWNSSWNHEMPQRLYSILDALGYTVLGDPDDIFADKGGKAELFIGARVKHIEMKAHYDEIQFTDLSGVSSTELEVEWQLHDNLLKRTVLKKMIRGAATVDFEEDDIELSYYKAMENSFYAFTSDPEFQRIVKDIDASVQSSSSIYEGSQKVSFATAKDSRSMEEVRKSVVTIIAGSAHGSGFLVSEGGLILTNRHVVEDAPKLVVMTYDKKRYNARVLAENEKRDAALIIVDEKLPLRPLKINPGQLKIAQEVFACGSPQERHFAGSITKGVVSSFRRIKGVDWIQSDVVIYGGNSGGPLLDAKGNVVGISTWGYGDTESLNMFGPIMDVLKTLNIKGQ